MTAIRQEDFIQSIADAFQFISYYHPLDYITALGAAYEREESPAAKDAIAQILTNSRMSAEGHRPICQDTGIALVFLKVGMHVQWNATLSVQEMVNEGVRRAYGNADNPLRASVLADPAGARRNTKDNTPAVVHYEIVPGHHVEVICAAKGGGSEAKAKFAMLNPSDDLVDWILKTATRVNLDTLTKEEVASWKPGQKLLLNGKMLTGRDAAHKRIADMLAKGETLPVDFTNRVIYYVGPVDPVRDEAVGPAGPTTATRMDKFTRMMLEKTGLISMVGKSERGPTAIEAIKDNKSAYLMAVGGAAYLVAKAIKTSKVVGFADLGMEAIYEFDLQDMPVTVAVDSTGSAIHTTGPKEWQIKIGKIPYAEPPAH